MVNKIFVYGTLMRGMSNEGFINDSSIVDIQKGEVKGDLYTVKRANFPALINVYSKNTVYGELYEIKEEDLIDVISKCDFLEGHPTLYKRIIVKVKDEKGNFVDAYTYKFMRTDMVGDLIKSGKFM